MSVRPSVRRSVGPSVCRNAFAFRPTRSDICRVYGLVLSPFRVYMFDNLPKSLPFFFVVEFHLRDSLFLGRAEEKNEAISADEKSNK